MKVKPVYNTPALSIDFAGERALVVADLHLGIECELAERGISLPSQIPKVKEKLFDLVRNHKANLLVILGDVKHNVPTTTWYEWRELPKFFDDLIRVTKVEIVRGNHDGYLEGMVPREVVVHDSHGMVIGKLHRVGLMHGHTWPAPELFGTELIVMGHNHPAIEFRDELGGKSIEPVWLRAKLDARKFPKKLKPFIRENPPEILVIPAFSELVGGVTVNLEMNRKLIGPMFRAGAVKLDEAEAYLLDGTFLGKIRRLKK